MRLAAIALAFFALQDEKIQDVQTRLQTRVTVDFSHGTPLMDALTEVQRQTGINVLVSAVAKRVVDDATTELVLDNVTAKSALRIMLGDHGLTLTLRKNVLMVIEKGELADQMVTKNYNVADLLTTIESYSCSRLEPAVREAFMSETPTSTVIGSVHDNACYCTPHAFLTENVKSLTGEVGWDNPKAGLSLAQNQLVVTQTPKAQEAVVRVLEMLRTAR